MLPRAGFRIHVAPYGAHTQLRICGYASTEAVPTVINAIRALAQWSGRPNVVVLPAASLEEQWLAPWIEVIDASSGQDLQVAFRLPRHTGSKEART